IASHTKQPGVLRELFAALGNDAFVIAESLARPVLAARLIAGLSTQGKTRRVEPVRSEMLRSVPIATLAKAAYIVPRISNGDPPCTVDTWMAINTTNAPSGRELHTAVWTGSEMIVWGGQNSSVLNTGGRYTPSTDSRTPRCTTN